MNKRVGTALLALVAVTSTAYAEDKAIGVDIDLADLAGPLVILLALLVGIVFLIRFVWARVFPPPPAAKPVHDYGIPKAPREPPP